MSQELVINEIFNYTPEKVKLFEISSRNNWNFFHQGLVTGRHVHSIYTKMETRKKKNCDMENNFTCIQNSGLTSISSPAIRHGQKFESIAYKAFLESTNNVNNTINEPGIHLEPNLAVLGSTPDGIILHQESKIPVEIKCPFTTHGQDINQIWKSLDFLKCKIHVGRSWKKECHCSGMDNVIINQKHQYYFQVQTEIGCLGADYGYFYVYMGEGVQNLCLKIPKDQPLYNKIKKNISMFYVKFFLPFLFNDL